MHQKNLPTLAPLFRVFGHLLFYFVYKMVFVGSQPLLFDFMPAFWTPPGKSLPSLL